MEAFNSFITKVEAEILGPIVTVLALLAFVLFVWGVVQFIASSGDEEKRRIGQQHMFWGIIGLVILFGANGIIAFLTSTISSTLGTP
ncbi:MAG TPA: hypothetical protein VFY28_01270 [Candidatus Paceibacterota bacterium]|nr:hypothetical protein [Candidatus Paceibacterota bacterium]